MYDNVVSNKIFKCLDGLEEKYSQIQTDIDELSKKMSSYSIMDAPVMKENKNLEAKMSALNNTEKKIILNVIEDVRGHVGYTTNVINIALQNSYDDIVSLRESVNEYHEIIEGKLNCTSIKKSSSNLKSEEAKGENLYDMFIEEPDKSDKSYSRGLNSQLEIKIKNLDSKVKLFKSAHKSLFDTISENLKILSKIHKSKDSSGDSIKTLKDLYSKSNLKLKELINQQHSLHYKKSKKVKSKREHINYASSLSPAREFKSAATIAVQSEAGENTQNLIDRIDSLRKEIKDLKESKMHADLQLKSHETHMVKHKMLKDEYESLKRKYEELRDANDERDNTINELTRTNTKYNERITTLQSENRSLENLLNQNRDNEHESVKEFKNVLSRAKKSCESQITNIEHDFEARIGTLKQQLQTKEQKLQLLSNKFSEFRQTSLSKLEQDAKVKLNEKISEIQTLNSRNKDLKATIDELTTEKENIDNKLKRTQGLVRDLQKQLEESMEEQSNLRKQAEEQETITNSLYEERLKEKNKETEDLNKEMQRKDSEIYQLKQDALKLDTKRCNLENKIKGIHSLVAAHSEQVAKDGAKLNPTIKLVLEELGAVTSSPDLEDSQNADRLNKMRELLKENEKLEEQINQLKWDIDKETSNAKRAMEDRDRTKNNYNQHLTECKDKMLSKNNEINDLREKLLAKDEHLTTFEGDRNNIQQTLEKAKKERDRLQKALDKYKTFSVKI